MKILLKSIHVLPSSHGLESVVNRRQLQRGKRDVDAARVIQKIKKNT